jgi:glyoxylase-like metal-dependent hydrolase (beta-lactamase superfamily II)
MDFIHHLIYSVWTTAPNDKHRRDAMALYSVEPITDRISMIDIELFGIKRVGAVFLIRGGLTCLVDSGTPKEVKGLIRTLDAIGAFPPDILILTHSHWDHTQGTPTLRREAEKRGKPIKGYKGAKRRA